MAKKVLELFAGSRSIGRAAEALGLQVFSSDLKSFEGINYAVDVLEFDTKEVPFVPDIIWASPPCTTYSIAAISHHRNGTEPKSDFAKKSDKMLEKIKELIEYYTRLNPSLLYYIENPRGMMRKMPVMRNYAFRHTVTYCQYGDERMKPTDIWTNNIRWTPRAACKNGMSCHTPAPRGSRTGTQGLKNNYERSKIPQQLCLEVLKATL